MNAVFAPAKTHQAIVARLNREIVNILSRDDEKQRLFLSGEEVVGSSPTELVAAMKADMAFTGKMLRETGIRAD